MNRIEEAVRSEADTVKRDASFQGDLKDQGKCFSKELGRLKKQN